MKTPRIRERCTLGGQPLHHPGKDPHVAPTLPVVVERLGRSLIPGRIAPAQAVATDENYAAQVTPVVDAWLAMALGE